MLASIHMAKPHGSDRVRRVLVALESILTKHQWNLTQCPFWGECVWFGFRCVTC